ncbi:hypothetical protein BX666DRAFT_2030450 [Dichotomocladium elegans]|nr:hypothetical protein BX666DRAFT_2030450 [Dichotomocladium elegans]
MTLIHYSHPAKDFGAFPDHIDEDAQSEVTASEYASSRFKSNIYLFLEPDDVFMDRAFTFSERAETMRPYQLSTISSAKDINCMTTEGLIRTIAGIFELKTPHLRESRAADMSLYNWILVDLCRRLEVLDARFTRIYDDDKEFHWRDEVVEAVHACIYHTTTPSGRSGFPLLSDRTYFDMFVPFVARKRSKVLKTVSLFGDEICLFTEFIDFKKIGDMKQTEYDNFIHDLLLCREDIDSRIKQVPRGYEESSPVKPFKRMTLLNAWDSDKASFIAS